MLSKNNMIFYNLNCIYNSDGKSDIIKQMHIIKTNVMYDQYLYTYLLTICQYKNKPVSPLLISSNSDMRLNN